jgi:tellurite resistance protein
MPTGFRRAPFARSPGPSPGLSPGPSPFIVVTRPPAEAVESIASAAALMARIDGSADEVERRALLRFLRGHDLLRRFGRRAWMSAYAHALHRETTDEAELDFLGQQRGQTAAPLIAAAAASVALADGHAHPAELGLLRALAERLCLIGASDQLASQAAATDRGGVRQEATRGLGLLSPGRAPWPSAARVWLPA